MVASPYKNAVPVKIPTKMLAAKPDFRFTNIEYVTSTAESIAMMVKLSQLMKKDRIKPAAKSTLETATTCRKESAPEGMGRFGLINASLSLSKKSFIAKPAEVMKAIEKKISKADSRLKFCQLLIAKAVSSDKPPVISQ